jgi:hypothetical protein
MARKIASVGSVPPARAKAFRGGNHLSATPIDLTRRGPGRGIETTMLYRAQRQRQWKAANESGRP